MLFVLGIIVGILLSAVFFMAGNKKEEIVKTAKHIMGKDRGYIAGVANDDQPIKDLYDSSEDIKIK